MTKAEIQKALDTDIKPRKKAIEDEHKQIIDKFKESIYSVDSVIADADEAMMRHHLATIDSGNKAWAVMVSKTEKLIEEINELSKQASPKDKIDDLGKLTKELSALSTKLSKNFTAGKASLKKLEDALKDRKKDAVDVAKEWAIMEAWLRRAQEARKKAFAKIEAARDSAKKAALARDAKGLDAAQKASEAAVDTPPTLDDVKEAYGEFCNECASKVHPGAAGQLASDRKEFEGIVEEIAKLTAKMVAHDIEIQGLEIAKIDVKKAAAELNVPKDKLAKFEKALSLDTIAAIEKALDPLAKDVKMKNGKEMVAALTKAGLL
jgi:hypothetical protein